MFSQVWVTDIADTSKKNWQSQPRSITDTNHDKAVLRKTCRPIKCGKSTRFAGSQTTARLVGRLKRKADYDTSPYNTTMQRSIILSFVALLSFTSAEELRRLQVDQRYTAVNDKGFEVDILRREAVEGDPHPLRLTQEVVDF